jgi:hypothetical protein
MPAEYLNMGSSLRLTAGGIVLLPPASGRKWFLLFRLDVQNVSCHDLIIYVG